MPGLGIQAKNEQTGVNELWLEVTQNLQAYFLPFYKELFVLSVLAAFARSPYLGTVFARKNAVFILTASAAGL